MLDAPRKSTPIVTYSRACSVVGGDFMKTLIADIRRRAWLRSFSILLAGLFAGLLVLSTAAPAHAVGRVVWKSKTIKERVKRESWYLEMQVHLPHAPDVGNKSMKFEFTQVAEFERELVDGREGPQSRTVPLTGQQSLIETVMVGFMDPGTSVIQSRTKFSFKLTRAHGYKAGKWKVKIRDSDNGKQIGQVATLTLSGENPVVDRRSITFQGTKKEPKEEEAPEETQYQAPVQERYEGEDVDDEGQVPPSVEGKPGGGCHLTPVSETSWGFLLFLAGLGVGLALRRRRA